MGFKIANFFFTSISDVIIMSHSFSGVHPTCGGIAVPCMLCELPKYITTLKWFMAKTPRGQSDKGLTGLRTKC